MGELRSAATHFEPASPRTDALAAGCGAEHVPGGYRLVIDADAIDAARFAEAAARGRDALARGISKTPARRSSRRSRSGAADRLLIWTKSLSSRTRLAT